MTKVFYAREILILIFTKNEKIKAMRFLLFISTIMFAFSANAQSSKLNGSWLAADGKELNLILIQDGYLTSTIYTTSEFISTSGGTIEIADGKIILNEEFNTSQKALERKEWNFEVDEAVLVLNGRYYKHMDNSAAPLAGVWKISHVMRDGELQQIQHTGTRKTLKLLTGTKFQWFAIDPDGNQFFGTGGGSYTFENGKYVEHIEFFSRDNSRVGASLSFDDKVEDGKWIHTGLSSKGDPIHEVWEKIK